MADEMDFKGCKPFATGTCDGVAQGSARFQITSASDAQSGEGLAAGAFVEHPPHVPTGSPLIVMAWLPHGCGDPADRNCMLHHLRDQAAGKVPLLLLGSMLTAAGSIAWQG